MGFFSKILGRDDWKQTLVRDLAMLTAVDGDMDKKEIAYVMKVAVEELGFSEQKFVDLMQNLGDVKDIYPDEHNDKLEFLEYLLKMTYVDGYVDDNEVEYMKLVAQRMNLPISAIDQAIAYVESEPEGTSSYSKHDENISDDFIKMYKNGHLFLSEEIQVEMTLLVHATRLANNDLMDNQSKEQIIKCITASRDIILKAEQINDWLNVRNIIAFNSGEIASAFYLVSLGRVSFGREPVTSDNYIRNTMATIVSFGSGNIGQGKQIDPSQIAEINIENVRVLMDWLESHTVS